MAKSPCENCPHRKLTCHDRCEEYLTFHAELVAAKDELRKAYNAIDFLIDMYVKREKKAGLKR